jgi:hypothetical protein
VAEDFMIWKLTAEVKLGLCALEHTLTLEAPDLAAALDTGRRQLAGMDLLLDSFTGLVQAPCTAVLPWARTRCRNVATRVDGYCDECRDELRQCGDFESEQAPSCPGCGYDVHDCECSEDDGQYRIGFGR